MNNVIQFPVQSLDDTQVAQYTLAVIGRAKTLPGPARAFQHKIDLINRCVCLRFKCQSPHQVPKTEFNNLIDFVNNVLL